MKCWVCTRQARGYGHTDNRHGIGHPARYPIDWVFCSRRCQDAFHALYGNWQQANLERLLRSFNKESQLHTSFYFVPENWQALMNGYQGKAS